MKRARARNVRRAAVAAATVAVAEGIAAAGVAADIAIAVKRREKFHAAVRKHGGFSFHELAGVENAARIEGVLDQVVHAAHFR